MEASETYIKMCDCPEIQEFRREEKHKDTGKWQEGDFWTTVFREQKVFIVARLNDAWADEPHYLHHPIECIWLPRQDQLQEMVIPEPFRDWRNVLSFFDDFIDWDNLDEYGSMEQLWLAFVMKEKYNKVWDGEKWVEDIKG